MARWIVYRVTATHMGGAGRSLEKLGGLNARHYGHALLKAGERWPQYQGALTIKLGNKREAERNAKAGKRALAEIREAYREELEQ
jgi:hypothetical protein